MITVKRIQNPAEVSLADINALLSQLRTDANEPGGAQADLEVIASSANIVFVVVQDGEKTIGIATAYIARKFGKTTGFVEDVVVDQGYRGQGLGEKLMSVLIEESRKAGATKLMLTSRPHRTVAHKLYEKLGFQRKETDVFRLKL